MVRKAFMKSIGMYNKGVADAMRAHVYDQAALAYYFGTTATFPRDDGRAERSLEEQALRAALDTKDISLFVLLGTDSNPDGVDIGELAGTVISAIQAQRGIVEKSDAIEIAVLGEQTLGLPAVQLLQRVAGRSV